MIDKIFIFVLFDEIIEETSRLEENIILMNKFN